MKWAIFFAVLFILSAVLNVFFLTKGKDIKTTLPTYKVLEVFDGDSFLIEGKHEIRLRQAQAPEKGLCGHIEAKNALTKLIKDKYVKLDYQIPDIYGRQMAMVFVDDLNVNKEMVISGLARYHHDTTPFEKEMKLAGIKAKENGVGIFSKCEIPSPPNPECILKGNIRTQKKTKIYYLPSCAQYKTTIISEDLGEHWFCSEKEAKAAGFVKAETCK